MKSIDNGWRFKFCLTEPIDCEEGRHDREDIKFVTKIEEEQMSVTGFEIMVNDLDYNDALTSAERIVKTCTAKFIVESWMISEYYLEGAEKIIDSKTTHIKKRLDISYSISNNAILSIPDEMLKKEWKSSLAVMIKFCADAQKAIRYGASDSAIKYLVLACNEELQGEWEKFRHLRNALSHNKKQLRNAKRCNIEEGPEIGTAYRHIDKLINATRCKIEEGFGKGHFDFTEDDKFDFMSSKNQKLLARHANDFLEHTREEIKRRLQSDRKRRSSGS